jgi:leucyl aminopeptidase
MMMHDLLVEGAPQEAVAIIPLEASKYASWLARQAPETQAWLKAVGFTPEPGLFCLLPDGSNGLASVVVGVSSPEDPWALADLPQRLPEGLYRIEADWAPASLERAALGWGLGAYRFTRYVEAKGSIARLAMDSAGDLASVRCQLEAIFTVRNLINTPAQDMMPEQLGQALVDCGARYGAQVNQIVGDDLLEARYPAIHAVGRASDHAPRLLDLRWGDDTHPKLTLVGKGVCFDSGGLDLKPASGMRLMKKDMGGAAHAIGLAQLVMSVRLPVRLRVLVAAVENAVSGNALHPGDVIASRKGLSIEIENTDAEGRLVLCDALAEAGTEKPDLIFDFATLTGAARVAVGTDVAALFASSEEVAAGLSAASEVEWDPVWRLPLHTPYRELIASKVADISNASKEPYAGAITAALFLREFVPQEVAWAHFDIMGWNTRSRPGRPEGGEAMGLRAAFAYLRQRYSEDS